MERGSSFNPEIGAESANEHRMDTNESIQKLNALYEEGGLGKAQANKEFLKEIESLPDYVQYKEQPVVYETFDAVIASVKEQIDDLPQDKQMEIAQTIQKLADSIKLSLNSYYEAVRRHHHAEKRRLAGQDEFGDRLRQADQARTNAHNSLMSNLAAFSRMCFVTLSKTYDLELDRKHWFQGYEFDNRHILGQWALRTEFGHRVDVLKRSVEQNIKKEAA